MIIATESGLGFKHEIAHSSAGRQKETRYLTDLPRNFWITVTVMGSIPDCNSSILNTDLYMLWNSCIPPFVCSSLGLQFLRPCFYCLGFCPALFSCETFSPFSFQSSFKVLSLSSCPGLPNACEHPSVFSL